VRSWWCPVLTDSYTGEQSACDALARADSGVLRLLLLFAAVCCSGACAVLCPVMVESLCLVSVSCPVSLSTAPLRLLHTHTSRPSDTSSHAGHTRSHPARLRS
jgi:hypothetical protein